MAAYLTTLDNKIDPSVDFDAWYYNDTVVLGYDTCGKIARIATMFYGYNDELSDEKKEAIKENAIDDLIRLDFLGIYRKIKT